LLSGIHAYTEKPAFPVKNKFRIAIFKEENFPYLGAPASLTAEWLYNHLSKNFSLTYLDSAKLGDKKYLNPDNFNLLIMPYGETFPYEAFRQIKNYLFIGGGLLNIAGRPFGVPMSKIAGKWQKLNIDDPYKEFLSPLGIKYYEFSDNEDIGLSVTTSIGFSSVQPTRGNVFPYRIPARDFYFLEITGDKKNEYPLIFVKSWRNPYYKESKEIPNKWCLIGAKGERHPLNPQNSNAQKALLQIIEYLSYPIIIYELETDLAAYHQKEKVGISLKVMNRGKINGTGIVEFELWDEKGRIVYKKSKLVKLSPKQKIILKEIWHPKEFQGAFYKIRAVLKRNNLILDKEENGFVVINEDILRNGPSVHIKGNEFIINGKKSFILGVNYYESKRGELMWLKPNILKIREDFKSMRDSGINFVRIHYHHSKWFRDYFSQVLKEDLDPYLQVADTTALPSERSLRILDAIIQLAQEQHLVFCMDIFSLVPKEMGNPIGWLGLKERILNKNKVTIQKKFTKLLALRYKNIPAITWDLWNEPRLEKKDLESLREWSRQIRDSFRKNGDTHSITIGDDLSLYFLDVLDYACVHTDDPREFSSMRELNKPIVFQEVWNSAGCSLNEEIKQSEELKKDFTAFLETKAAGFVPWQWTRQARLWDNASDSERWDDELGLCVYEDGTLKAAGRVYSLLISTIKER
jgi:hypothetical protein